VHPGEAGAATLTKTAGRGLLSADRSVIVARINGDTVLTGDPNDLVALDPTLRIERV
jgi:hypothetical protein